MKCLRWLVGDACDSVRQLTIVAATSARPTARVDQHSTFAISSPSGSEFNSVLHCFVSAWNSVVHSTRLSRCLVEFADNSSSSRPPAGIALQLTNYQRNLY